MTRNTRGRISATIVATCGVAILAILCVDSFHSRFTLTSDRSTDFNSIRYWLPRRKQLAGVQPRSHTPHLSTNFWQQQQQQQPPRSVSLSASLWDELQTALLSLVSPNTALVEPAPGPNARGTIVQCAAKPLQSDGASKPSSKSYSPKKVSQPFVTLSPSGVMGDYNHYRTVALENTNDRAVSILTMDVLRRLSAFEPRVELGDLGENLLVEGLPYHFFRVGGRYTISSGVGSDSTAAGTVTDGIVIEVTEPIVPCSNLCTLHYINSPELTPVQRIEKCQAFLGELGIAAGFRGWYATVVGGDGDGNAGGGGGVVKVGDSIMAA